MTKLHFQVTTHFCFCISFSQIENLCHFANTVGFYNMESYNKEENEEMNE